MRTSNCLSTKSCGVRRGLKLVIMGFSCADVPAQCKARRAQNMFPTGEQPTRVPILDAFL